MYCRQWHPIPSHQLSERCAAVKQLRRSPRSLLIRTRLSSMLRLNMDSSLKTSCFHSAVVEFTPAQHHSKRRSRCVGIKDNTRNGRSDPK
ncbi:hypothetical protein TNCV_4527931 [Trichonephila clavipes]|nr:hypothetical protein TNCV_4527931 [Trichonephila clavipes]